jgi:hypothetical protein
MAVLLEAEKCKSDIAKMCDTFSPPQIRFSAFPIADTNKRLPLLGQPLVVKPKQWRILLLDNLFGHNDVSPTSKG